MSVPVTASKPQKPEVIIWDFNGTLLDDVGICVEAINVLLAHRSLPLINEGIYKEVFTFPVQAYYEAVGFDFSKEDFEIPALAFMDLYIEKVRSARLHPQATEVISQLGSMGIRQVVLSAMEQELLNELFDHFALKDHFEAIYGIENHFGHGKTHRGIQLIEQLNVNPANCLFIGDTLHDQEVAQAIGCSNLLVGIGHQSVERLMRNGNIVLPSLNDIPRFIA